MRNYWEKQKELSKRYHANLNEGLDGFDGFSLKDKIALVEWQLDVLDANSELTKVREAYKKWEVELLKLRKLCSKC